MLNKKTPKISVIMPVYNTPEEYLREAIESILNQTYSDFEFIVINDGSTDNSENIILSYKDDRIKYTKNNNNLGLIKTLNNGLELAQGDYIARMDSDDISLPERFEKQILFLENNPDISVLGSAFEIFPNQKIIKHPKYPTYLDFIKYCMLGHPTVILRKSDFKKHNFKYDEKYKHAEDYELWSRLIRVLNVANLQEILLKYRVHENNISKTQSDVQMQNTDKIRQNMLDFLSDNKTIQDKIFDLAAPLKLSFIQKIFSIKNHRNYKVITILGLSAKIKLSLLRS